MDRRQDHGDSTKASASHGPFLLRRITRGAVASLLVLAGSLGVASLTTLPASAAPSLHAPAPDNCVCCGIAKGGPSRSVVPTPGAPSCCGPVIPATVRPVVRIHPSYSSCSPTSAPLDLVATVASGSTTLSWHVPVSFGGSPLLGYNIFEGTTSGGETVVPVLITATTYTVTGLTNGSRYFFYVTGINSSGWSGPSNEVSVIPATPPGAPSGLAATGAPASVALSWSPPASDGDSPVTGYDLFEGTSAGGESLTPVNATPVSASTFTVTGLTNMTTYYFTVEAINAAGDSMASNEASATPAAGPSTTSLSVSQASVSSSSQHKVHFTVTVAGASPTGAVRVEAGSQVLCTVALVAGAGSCRLPAHSLGKGSYTVVADYAGDANNNPSASSGSSLTVR